MNKQNSNVNLVQRTPRIRPLYPEGVLPLEDPARPSEKPTISWLIILLPPIAMMVISIFSAILFRSYMILFSIMGMTMVTVMVSIMNYKSSVKKHLEQNKKLEKKYLDYLYNVRNELQAASNQYREAVRQIHPSINDCIEIVRERRKQLWERTALEQDFLHIRMGVGILPIALQPNYEARSKAIDDENPLEKIASKICEEMYYVRDIPVSVPLYDISTLGFVGKRDELRQFLNATTTHLTTHHGYDDIKIVCLLNQDELKHWDWMRWLPHMWDKDRKVRYIASNSYEAARLADELLPEIKARSKQNSNSGYMNRKLQLPHYIFLIFAPDLWENSEIMKYLLSNNQMMGITSIFISERIDFSLPQNCQVIIEVSDKQGVVRKDTINKMNELNHYFITDHMDRDASEAYSRCLSPVKIKETHDNNLIPKLVTFLDSFGIKQVEDLHVLTRWQENEANRSLIIPLGQAGDSKTFYFDMHEKFYGPHGLVAGTTGSGKSELLQSLLLALAVNYHPHEVAFVLIDYKGGGMANAFLGLPHLVGTITNLGGNQINRALASIKSELMRRQRLFSDANVTNIDDYIIRYRNKTVELPLPHLIIVVDEFAELKSDQPEFMKEMVSAARVGRSLGIHLILATQKPSGVVDDQIWSNSRFKLCLKVQTPSDSQEMLKRPEAAGIKEKGRGYLQVGNDEVFTLFQSSWSGAPYHTSVVTEESSLNARIVGLNGERRPMIAQEQSRNNIEKVTQLQSVVNHIITVAEDNNIHEAFQLWLPPLPEFISLSDLLSEGSGWNGQQWNNPSEFLAAPVGMIDNPSQQSQYQLTIDFAKNGHLLLYGMPGSGKTTFLKTIIASFAMSYKPDYVNFYILDFGTRTLGVFHDLPHLGEVIYPEEETKLNNLFEWLLKELEDRKRKFSQLGISNLVSYRSATGEMIPAIVLLLDNYTGFSEMYDDRSMDVVKIVREGGSYGIYFVSTGNAVNSFPYRISQNVKQTLVLQLADKTDYSSIIGRTEGLEPASVPGRGLVKEQVPLEYHAALPVSANTDDQIAEGIRNLCKQMKEGWKEKGVKKIEALPVDFTMDEFLNRIEPYRSNEENMSCSFPIAIDWESGMPVYLSAKDAHCLLLSYLPSVNYDVIFESIIHSYILNCGKTEHRIGIFECIDNSLSPVRKMNNRLQYMTNKDDFIAFTSSIVDELQIRKNESRDAQAAAPDPDAFNEKEFILNRFPLITIIIPHLKSAIDEMENESLQHLERIARFGGDLGVLLLVGADVEALSMLLLMTTLVPVLIDNKNAIIVGGKPNQHDILSDSFVNMNHDALNRKFQDGEGLLLSNNKQIKIKLVTKL
ncbi:type VII secretion protein EssC [Paenibacillus oenotherae]|uniref:Type VII secretion protein EssC n=1 Tax=Paenibacillus oenotherae TaxID=1435645 RepID=A0ABS7D5I1_9BACL|nr:type VII secretion protein EssC [Paenibacillus oenotherae]MBW7475202.1 type VII secretion protein EssC [Paenibacillus oenotherae]